MLISEERIHRLADDAAGEIDGDRYRVSVRLRIARLLCQVERETAEACAKICDEEAQTLQRSVIQASITIRRHIAE